MTSKPSATRKPDGISHEGRTRVIGGPEDGQQPAVGCTAVSP